MHLLKIFSDMETPVSAFLKLATHTENCFLLESTEHEASFGRYSFIGIGKRDEFVFTSAETLNTTPLRKVVEWLKNVSSKLNIPDFIPFAGGAFGYVSYDYVRYLENIKTDTIKFPVLNFMIPENLVVFDHFKNQISIIGDDPEKIVEKLSRSAPPSCKQKAMTTEPISNYSKEEFCKAVEKAKQHIVDGDVFQVVLSQRYNFRTSIHPFSIYRALRMINPSPYMFYLKFGEKVLLGSSPEMMSKYVTDTAVVKPIAGTRPRGSTVDEDVLLEKELLNDEKEKAEHVMLVDLARNDLGRVCKKGSVKVDEEMFIQRFSHVMHIVSQVSGKLSDNKDAVDVFEATFPAGTVSGAPKVRAMEIINALEPVARGPYAGAVCYFTYPDKNKKIMMDSGIMLRSMFFDGEEAYMQAGAGIVYDSIPEKEYQETINKLNVLFHSLEVAKKIQGGLL